MLGNWLRGQREKRGWSQSELARRAGISATAINLLESNRRRQPQADTAHKLAQVFGITPDELYRAAYAETAPDVTLATDDPPRGRLDYWVKAIVGIGPELTAQERVAVLDHAEALRDRPGR